MAALAGLFVQGILTFLSFLFPFLMKFSAETVKTRAREAGFSACGIVPAEKVASWRVAQVRQWLDAGRNGTMDYLSRHFEMRADPTLLVPGAKSIICVALNYFPALSQQEPTYHFARYAYGQDYHEVVRRKLRQLQEQLGLTGRAFCDTAPVDERYWAWRSGLGWLGRNTQLIVPHAGSYFFLGELMVMEEADAYDEPMASRCGSCRACIEACPAGALSADKGLDARRCLSYLTIESREDLPAEAAGQMGNCVYGCDRCAEACPWNRFAQPTQEADLQPREAFLQMTAADWQQLTREQYQQLFKGSAVKRAKYEGLVRNIKAVAGAHEPDKKTSEPDRTE